jgi:hypothetical protein
MEAFSDHPEYKRLCEFGIDDVSQRQRIFTIYLDLIESKGWFKVALNPIEKNDVVLVTGHPSATEERLAVWPVASDAQLSMAEMQSMIKDIADVSPNASSLLLGIVDTDSTVVYYSLTNGLVPPESADDQNAAKVKQRRRNRRRRMRHAIAFEGQLAAGISSSH